MNPHSFPYACTWALGRSTQTAGHWPTGYVRNSESPRPTRGNCESCGKPIFLRIFSNNASRYAATIIIKEWP